MTEYINKTVDPAADGQPYGLPGQQGDLYVWQRILAGGGTSEFSEVRMRGPIYDKNGVEILGGGGGPTVNNFTAVTDPTVNDDTTMGYVIGSEWLNTLTGIFFKARSVAVGAASWPVNTAQSGTNLVFNKGTVAGTNGILITPTGVGQVSGDNSVAIGNNAIATNVQSLAIGLNSTASQLRSIAVGTQSQSTAADTIAVGALSIASVTGGIAIGSSSSVLGADSIAIGNGSAVDVGAPASIAIGYAANAKASQSIALGHSTIAQAANSIAVGYNAQVNNVASTNSICIGSGCQVNNVADVILIGQNSTCSGADSVVVGHDAASTASNSVAIGDSTLVQQTGGVALGSTAQVLVAPNPLISLGFGGIDPVVVGTQFSRLPARIGGNNRNILLRDTDLALDDLSDVAITSLQRGQNLTYNGTNWVNTDIPFSNGFQPASISGLLNAPLNTFQNNTIRFVVPWETSRYRYCRVWADVTAVTTGAVRVTIYDGAPNAGGARKCYSDAITPASGLAFLVLDLSFVVDSDLIFVKGTTYTILISSNNPGATSIRLGGLPAGISNAAYGGYNTATNYVTVVPPATCPSLAASVNRASFLLSNEP